jgi:hypothetical protein
MDSGLIIIPPEWRPGFLLDWGEGGDDGCGTPTPTTTTTTLENNTATREPSKTSTNIPLTGHHSEASDEEDPETDEELSTTTTTQEASSSNDELGTGQAPRAVKFEMNLQRLKEYKETYGTVAVLAVHCRDGRFEGLYYFLNYWRRKVKKSCRKVKNCKTEANIRQLIDLGVDFETPVPWSPAFESKLQLLKEYKEVYGTVNVLAKHCNTGKFQGLNYFLSNWHSKAKRFDQGEETTKKTEANIRKLIDLGVDFEAPSPSPSPAFESNLQLLKEYKEVYGTLNVLAKHCNTGKFQGLNYFLSNWRHYTKRFDQGKETTKNAETNIRKLIDLGVDLKKTPPSIG